MIAVESGPERIGAWVSEERNIHRDYVSYFGEDPPEVIAIAIMTDTDNTGEKAVAYYEDMTLFSLWERRPGNTLPRSSMGQR